MKRFTYLILILLLTANSFAQGHFVLAFSDIGQDHMTINVLTATIGGVAMEAGDEIAAFDGTICCGKVILTQPIVFSDINTSVAIAASRDDGSGNGYTTGHTIIYKFWDASKSKEILGISTEYFDPITGFATTAPTYTIGETAFVKLTVAAPVNQTPVSNAGPDQSVNEGDPVNLDGSASSDPDSDPLSYVWTAPAGITLSSTTVAKPTFTAPQVNIDTDYTFSLVVNDRTVNSAADQVVIKVKQVNKIPVANAGVDQSLNEGVVVTLDGTASSDPDNNTLAFLWTAPAGITLSSNTAIQPTFTAPEVNADTNYTFSLVVRDGIANSPTDQVIITVKQVNKAPVANAGPDQSPVSNTLVTLDASASSDPDNNALTYLWTAPAGITLSSTTVDRPTFTAPIVNVNTNYNFSLVVSDGKLDSPSDQVVITVKPVNSAPIANAGPDQTQNEGTLVTLDGTASTDTDNDPLNYQWTAPVGVVLSSATVAKPTFTAPEVNADIDYTFTLVVNDGKADSPADQVVISVKQVNKAPSYTSAELFNAREDEPVEFLLEGTDPDSNPISFSIGNLPSFLTLTKKTDTSATLSGTFTNNNLGDNQFNLTLTDGLLNTLEIITIHVAHVDHPPYVKDSIKNVSVYKRDPDQIIDLKSVFADYDPSDVLVYSVSSNSNEQVVKATLAGSNLTLSFSTENTGLSDIVISATSNGKEVQSRFKVEVKIPTGINPLIDITDVQIFPNPTQGNIQLKFSQIPKAGTWITVSDISGKIISRSLADNLEENLNLKENPSGLYFIRIDQKMPKTYKIVLK
ncbi:MAG: PKD domain-containing protein [Bacteroidota bacterium]|nr:PKD domain-containing protein [Bacteroidota bacterium]